MRWFLFLNFLTISAIAQHSQIAVPVVDKMPNLPQSLEIRDWKQVARDFDAIAFDFTKKGQFLPLPWWDDSRTNADLTGFALPAYVGDLRQNSETNEYDAITCLGAVLGATKVGIDKSDQDGRNWVEMLSIYYSSSNGTNLYMNNPGGKSGQSFWYELLPSLLFFQIHDHYRDEPGMQKQLVEIAEQWYRGCIALGAGEKSTPNFDHTAFNFSTGEAFDNPRWREPDAAAGVAWLEYMAFLATKDEKFLTAAKWAMQFLAERDQNPFYECLMPYGAYIAARMNAEQQADYPVQKFVNWVFDGDNPREWGVIAEKWGDVEAFGLQGSVHEGSEYAFVMNSFLAPAIMVPIVRYDARYARAMGKWVLNVAANSRYFYANAWKPDQQTSWEWASVNDPKSAIAYEGLRKQGMRRDRPADLPLGEALVPDANGLIERVWKIDVPAGEKQTLVIELKPRAETTDRHIQVLVSSSENGPWKPAFQFKPGSKNRKWLPLEKDGPLWISLRSEPDAKAKKKPLKIEQVYVETRLNRIPHVSGDPLIFGWGRTDLGLYGSSFVGLFAAMIEPTNVEGILRIDCRATESFADNSYPTFLLYNPHGQEKQVEFPVGDQAVDIYDTVKNRVVARNVTGQITVAIPPDEAVVLVVCPAGGDFTNEKGRIVNQGVVVDYSPVAWLSSNP